MILPSCMLLAKLGDTCTAAGTGRPRANKPLSQSVSLAASIQAKDAAFACSSLHAAWLPRLLQPTVCPERKFPATFLGNLTRFEKGNLTLLGGIWYFLWETWPILLEFGTFCRKPDMDCRAARACIQALTRARRTQMLRSSRRRSTTATQTSTRGRCCWSSMPGPRTTTT